jgi:hypothetical protein
VDETATFLHEMIERRLEPGSLEWLRGRLSEIAGGVPPTRFASSISLASRFVRRRGLEPDATELRRADQLVPGWNPERWNLLETARVALLLARPDLVEPSFEEALEDVFRDADEGESCALYRCLALLPAAERFLWRAGEGCRSNMVSIFEAVACDTPYPVRYFDDRAWGQLVIKTVFIGAPLWRVVGLDGRLSPELARMALDLADERRSAGRDIPPELWLCLGECGGERGVASLEEEFASAGPLGRQAAVLGLARAGQRPRLAALLESERDPAVVDTLKQALAGRFDQQAFRALEARSA